jgi:predicted transcriptional regulator
MSPRAAWRLEQLGFTEVYDYVNGKSDWLGYGLPTEGADASLPRAGDVVQRDVPTCRIDDDLGHVRERARAAVWDTCVVVNDTGIVLGRIRGDAEDGEPARSIEAVMEAGPTTTRLDEPLADLVQRMRHVDIDQMIVTLPDGRLVGIVQRPDAEQLLLLQQQHHDHVAG